MQVRMAHPYKMKLTHESDQLCVLIDVIDLGRLKSNFLSWISLNGKKVVRILTH